MGVVPRATVVGVVVRNVVSASFRNPFMVVVKRRDNCHVARRALKSVVYHRALIDHLRDQDLGRGGATESGTYKWLVDSVSCRSPGDAEWERAHPCILTGSNTSQPQRGVISVCLPPCRRPSPRASIGSNFCLAGRFISYDGLCALAL